MSFTLGSLRFSPSWRMSLLAAVIFAFLIRLGFWQLHRAEEKRLLIQAYTLAGEVVRDIGDRGIERFTRVNATGRWDRGKQFLLDNMVHRSQPGFYVLAPLLRDDDQVALLVNLGWIASTSRRDQLPLLKPLEEAQVHLDGRLNRLPQPGIRLSDPAAMSADQPWPRIVVFPTLEDLETQLGYPLYPHVLFLESQDDDGYVRDWQIFEFGPERHLGYAVQWFALGLALLIIYLVVNTRRVQRESEK